MFGVKPDPWQVEALDALADPHGKRRVSVRACHGPGKSALDAWTILWFLFTHFPTRIPCTAPTSHQLEDILWAELHKWHREMLPEFRSFISPKAGIVEWTDAPKESFAIARTARPEQPEALQGFHCENLLFVLDEASGIAENIFEVSEGALTEPGALVLMTGNPTRASGYFYESHTRMRHLWYTMRVSHADSPRVSDEYVQNMATKYGEDSNVYRVRVLGDFPTLDDDAVIPLELVESAVERDIVPWGDVAWGLDVAIAQGGDRTALAKRRANAQLEPVKSWVGFDTMQTVGRIVEEWDNTPDEEKPTGIYVDVIGIGAGVVHRLRELDLPVVGVNVSEQAAFSGRFMRRRDELWWRCREWLEERDVVLLDDAELIGELTLPHYRPTSSGKIQVEPKAETKKRLGSEASSPDLADAFVLTFAHRFERVRKARVGASYSRREQRRRARQQAADWVV